jgi:hypothetical protein
MLLATTNRSEQVKKNRAAARSKAMLAIALPEWFSIIVTHHRGSGLKEPLPFRKRGTRCDDITVTMWGNHSLASLLTLVENFPITFPTFNKRKGSYNKQEDDDGILG